MGRGRERGADGIKKSEGWPRAKQKRRRRGKGGKDTASAERRERERSAEKMNREGWPHITCSGGRMSAVGHWLSLSRAPRALFTLSPFSTDLS